MWYIYIYSIYIYSGRVVLRIRFSQWLSERQIEERECCRTFRWDTGPSSLVLRGERISPRWAGVPQFRKDGAAGWHCRGRRARRARYPGDSLGTHPAGDFRPAIVVARARRRPWPESTPENNQTHHRRASSLRYNDDAPASASRRLHRRRRRPHYIARALNSRPPLAPTANNRKPRSKILSRP